MSTVTPPRRSTRLPHNHTPKMTARKKGLFQGNGEVFRESLTQHRRLPVVDSESDTDDCDLGIMGALDSSSGEENQDQMAPKTPERKPWHETRSQTKKLLKETHQLKNFIKSPFTLKKYQTRNSHAESKNSTPLSTPVTPRLHINPDTPSSTHSCASAHTSSSTSSKARKSLASLIADAESCSSSLKDLNFDTDSGTDSKENTPTNRFKKSGRKNKTTPKVASFKGILMEQIKNSSPMVCLTKMDMMQIISPTQMLKTPHNTSEVNTSPPKLQSRRPVVEIAESPEEVGDCDKTYKRLRNDSISDNVPSCKYPKLDMNSAPKARLSLFNTDRLKEILSTKSFYGQSNPDLNTSSTTKLVSAITATTLTTHRRHYSHSHRRKPRKVGQINFGVKHKIKKPKIDKHKIVVNKSGVLKSGNESSQNNSRISDGTFNNSSMLSQSSPEMEHDKTDPFDKEKQTIEALLSQWTEEEVPDEENCYKPSEPAKVDPHCFNTSLLEETKDIFNLATAVPVTTDVQPNSEVILELGNKDDVVMKEPESHKDSHGCREAGKGFLPVEGGYIVVDEADTTAQEHLPDLDEIERELRMLDEQILRMAQSNNIDPDIVLASTEVKTEEPPTEAPQPKLFPIFSSPNPGTSTSSPQSKDTKKSLLKNMNNQYVIDAGQKKFGATQCSECGVIYQIGEPQDEHDHLVHHNATDVLKYNGYKDERVVGTWDVGRCVCIRGSEPTWKKVTTLLSRVIHPQLGYNAELPRKETYTYTAYLYIEKKQIIGALIMEPKSKAYKLIPGDPDCCSVEHYPVKCGVSRIWTHKNHRRRGIAMRMLDCARASFLYGDVVKKEDIAFSAPTSHGKALATKYYGTSNFNVYLD